MRLLVPFLVLLLLPAAQAQEPLRPELALQAPFLTGEAEDGMAPGTGGILAVPWSLTFASPAHAAAELAQEGSIAWTLTCDAPLGVTYPETVVSFTPGQAAYAGQADLTLSAQPDTPGARTLDCTVTGVFTGASSTATDSAQGGVLVLFDADLAIHVADPERKGGPQKIIRYAIDLTNNGNARTLVTWELVERPPGRWNAILPEPTIVDPGTTQTAILAVATPYENGRVSSSWNFTLRPLVSAADAPDQTGSAADIHLQASAEGWYVPGPSPALLLVALAGLALLRRR